jgi:hypothetical protein
MAYSLKITPWPCEATGGVPANFIARCSFFARSESGRELPYQQGGGWFYRRALRSPVSNGASVVSAWVGPDR